MAPRTNSAMGPPSGHPHVCWHRGEPGVAARLRPAAPRAELALEVADARARRLGDHRAGAHAGHARQHRFDFAGLDPKAPQFDLLIVSSEKLYISVFPPPAFSYRASFHLSLEGTPGRPSSGPAACNQHTGWLPSSGPLAKRNPSSPTFRKHPMVLPICPDLFFS